MPHRIVLDSDPIGDANLEALVKKAESADMYKALWQQTQARLDALEVRFEKEMAAKDAIIKDLLARNEALTQALARSQATPDNSGEPPGGRPQPRKAKRPPPENKTKKPAGGQRGHKGTTRGFETPTEIKDLFDGDGAPEVPDTPVESGFVVDGWELVERRQIIDVKVTRSVTEHRLWRRVGDTGATSKLFPSEATAPVCFSANVQAMALFLSSAACLPDRWVASTLTHLCDTKLAPSTIQAWRLTAAKNLSAFDDVLCAHLAQAPVVCADETPVRVANEKPRFLHVACNDEFTRFHLAGRDTASVTGGGVLDKFNGILVSDCYAPYWTLEVTHQRCVAHLLRDCQRVLDDHDGVTGDPASWAQDVIDHLRGTMGLTSRSDGRILKPLSWTKAHNRLTKLAQTGLDKHPVPDDDRKTPAVTTNARALARRLIEHGHEYLTAGSDEKVPWTNNAAERALRPAKVKQRRSGTYRSLRHAEAAARIAGYLDTARKHELDPHTALVALTGGDPWMPPAS